MKTADMAYELAAHASGIPSGAGLVSAAHVGASLSYLVGPFAAPFNFRLLGTVTGAGQTYTTSAGEGGIYVMELP